MSTGERILEFVAAYTAGHGFAPTVREIAQHVRLVPSNVLYHIERLERAGRLRVPRICGRRVPRCMRVVNVDLR